MARRPPHAGFGLTALLLLALSGPPAAAQRAPRPDPPPVPRPDGTLPGWTLAADGCSYARPGAPDSPRACSTSFPQADAPTADVAVARVVRLWGLGGAALTPVEDLGVMREVFGAPAFLVAGAGRLGRTPSRLAINLVLDRRRDALVASVVEAPAATWRAWGGAVVPIVAFGFARRPDAFDAAFRRGARAATPAQEVEIVEAFLTATVQRDLDALLAQHASVLQMMQRANANLSAETQCLLTEGCQARMGATGDVEPTPSP